MNENIKYATKPSLKEFLEKERQNRTGQAPPTSATARRQRTRSLSSSGRLEQSQIWAVNTKYAKVKPRIATRPSAQSARAAAADNMADSMNLLPPRSANQSKRDLNDSTALREDTYNKWYATKLERAQKDLEDARRRQKDDEEKKAQAMIDKLEKSKLAFKLWLAEKAERDRKKSQTTNKKTPEEIEREKEEKKLEGKKAYEEWLKTSKVKKSEQKEIEFERKRREEEKKRREKIKASEKKKKWQDPRKEKPPPAPISHNEWAKKKQEEIEQRKRSENMKKEDKEVKEAELRDKRERARQSYLEWLEKKEEEKSLKSSRALSSSMSSLPPFYPNSRTIPFGR